MCQKKCCLSHHAQPWESDRLSPCDCRYTDCLILVHLRTVRQSPVLSVQPSSFIGLQLPSVLARKTMGLDASGSQKMLGKARGRQFPVDIPSRLSTCRAGKLFRRSPRIVAAPLAIWLNSELLGRGSSGASPRQCGG